MGGEADSVEGEVAGDEAAPAGGAKLDGVGHSGLSLPVEGFLLHGVNVANKQDAEERNHGAKNEGGICREHIFINHSPREEENHFDVEQDEEHRHEIKLNRHARCAFAFGGHAAFVGGILGGIGVGAFADELGENEVAAGKGHGHAQQNQHRKVLLDLPVHGGDL